jgi:hypothetical protein
MKTYETNEILRAVSVRHLDESKYFDIRIGEHSFAHMRGFRVIDRKFKTLSIGFPHTPSNEITTLCVGADLSADGDVNELIGRLDSAGTEARSTAFVQARTLAFVVAACNAGAMSDEYRALINALSITFGPSKNAASCAGRALTIRWLPEYECGDGESMQVDVAVSDRKYGYLEPALTATRNHVGMQLAKLLSFQKGKSNASVDHNRRCMFARTYAGCLEELA